MSRKQTCVNVDLMLIMLVTFTSLVEARSEPGVTKALVSFKGVHAPSLATDVWS